MYIIAGFPRDWVKGGRECGNSNFQYIEIGFVRSCRWWSVGVLSKYPTGIPSPTTKPKVSIQLSSMCPERIFISDEDE
ncbi:hypothetical protein BOTNAR_0001g00130 [Botryotinia narcissicola]|uniref:Uncharacterized protein n=1 Tax=Botryotinia narcissicola TaxID=278944 RepID=A0A4Z1J9M0_9HELO|nr:hypothetical protein BOTNAR_0001g00130 [Botryotinia narcissicola]